jgi:hypothetical protein
MPRFPLLRFAAHELFVLIKALAFVERNTRRLWELSITRDSTSGWGLDISTVVFGEGALNPPSPRVDEYARGRSTNTGRIAPPCAAASPSGHSRNDHRQFMVLSAGGVAGKRRTRLEVRLPVFTAVRASSCQRLSWTLVLTQNRPLILSIFRRMPCAALVVFCFLHS